MDLQLAGRTYLVTGGSSGVGLATVRLLLEEGANVATCARSRERLDAAAATLRPSADAQALTAVCDVRSEEQTSSFVGAAVERFGGIDGLVNNAGQSRMKPFAETTIDDWNDEVDLKLRGVLLPLQAARPHLAASDAPAVVNVNAILARQPEVALVATSAARAAALNLSKSLSQELAADGIRVNSVCLGLIDTGQWRRRYEERDDGAPAGVTFDEWTRRLARQRGVALGRLGTADEVAYVITTLLSPCASFVTGATVDVGGGVGRYV